MKTCNLFVVLICALFLVIPCRAEEFAAGISLDAAYEMTLKSHPRIKMAEREIVKSSLLPEKANSEYFPRLYGYGYLSKADEEIIFGSAEVEPKEQAEADFELVQPLLEATYFPLKKQALREIDRSSEMYAQVVQDIFYQVAESYYQILEAKELIANAQKYLELAREDLGFSKVKFDAGEVTEDVVLQSELNVIRAEGNLIESKNMLRVAREVLKSTVGIDDVKFDVIQPPSLVLTEDDLETLAGKAMEFRPDYRVALFDIEQAKTDIEVTRAKFFPSLQGEVKYYVVDKPSFDQEEEYLRATLKLVVPFFEGGVRFTEMKEKREILSQAMLNRRDLENSIRIGIEDNLVRIESHKTILDNLQKQMELSQKSYEITKNKFDFGAATILELDAALATLNNVKTEWIKKTYEHQMALLQLQKTIGLFMKDKIVYSAPNAS